MSQSRTWGWIWAGIVFVLTLSLVGSWYVHRLVTANYDRRLNEDYRLIETLLREGDLYTNLFAALPDAPFEYGGLILDRIEAEPGHDVRGDLLTLYENLDGAHRYLRGWILPRLAKYQDERVTATLVKEAEFCLGSPVEKDRYRLYPLVHTLVRQKSVDAADLFVHVLKDEKDGTCGVLRDDLYDVLAEWNDVRVVTEARIDSTNRAASDHLRESATRYLAAVLTQTNAVTPEGARSQILPNDGGERSK